MNRESRGWAAPRRGGSKLRPRELQRRVIPVLASTIVRVSLRPTGRSPSWWTAVGAVALGCSLLYDLDTAQCSSTEDCAAFPGTECVASLCVTVAGTGGGNGTDVAHMGGEGGTAACTTHRECVDEHSRRPFLCKSGKCQSLTHDECPVVLGLGKDMENLAKPDPIVFGAYSYVDPTAPRVSVPTLNYELAIDEVNTATLGGLPGGAGHARRPFLAVVCSGTDSPNLEASLSHLIDDLEVPAILASLYAKDLLAAFESQGHPKNVFFLSPLEADSNLSGASDDGLLWHMLTSGESLAPAYLPLLARVEAKIRAELELASNDPIRVALVDADVKFLEDIADALASDLRFNGDKTPVENEADGNFKRVRIPSGLDMPNPMLWEALEELLEFAPHVVVAVASKEFPALLEGLEGSLVPAAPRPVYLGSPYLFGVKSFATVAPKGRTFGVNFAGAADTTLYDRYLSKLKSTYGSTGLVFDGSENFYDAAYFLMYAIAGAGSPPRLTGREVALGMTRLVTGKTEYAVGTRDVSHVIGTLLGSADSAIALQGTMGPPTFNTSTGVRLGLPSVYCAGSGTFVQDAMRYDPETKSLEARHPCAGDL